MKKNMIVVLVAALALAVFGLNGGAAEAKRLITGADIKNGSIGKIDLAPTVQSQLNQSGKVGPRGPAGVQGPAGPQGPAGDAASDVLGSLDGVLNGQATLAHIGGPFSANATQVGTLDLQPGTYLLSGTAFFDRVDDSQSSSPILQLAVRGVGAGLTAFTGNFPATGDREQTASAATVLEVTDPSTLTVYVFGYNNDGSGAGGGNYTASVQVSAVKVAVPSP